jgi:large subunit ribosomal protein L31
MQAEIHPSYKTLKVTCSCGEAFETGSTYHADTLHVEVCSKCHPFYTGKQKIVDVQGRLETYKKRFSSFSPSGVSAENTIEEEAPAKKAKSA